MKNTFQLKKTTIQNRDKPIYFGKKAVINKASPSRKFQENMSSSKATPSPSSSKYLSVNIKQSNQEDSRQSYANPYVFLGLDSNSKKPIQKEMSNHNTIPLPSSSQGLSCNIPSSTSDIYSGYLTGKNTLQQQNAILSGSFENSS